ncbi:MAG TPA: (Fe-S)-binding protein [Candidatus Anoxymicrobiaceae bacterium]
MLIESYDISFEAPECQHPSCDELRAKVAIDTDLTELIPYVNAEKQGRYLPAVPVVTWSEDGRNFALRPHELAVGGLEGREGGADAIRAAIDTLNDIWERRSQITPDHTVREAPKILDVFKILPRTNCKECGLPSCMGFAGELVAGNKKLDDCTPLLEDVNEDTRRKLLDMGLK